MKKILLSLFLISSFLFSEDLGKKTYAEIEELKKGKIENKLLKSPIDKKFLSIENGGEKNAIDAYSDGIGMYVFSPNNKINNSAMNRHVFAHGEEAKKEGKTLKAFLEENLGKFFEINIIESDYKNSRIGDECDDGRAITNFDRYIDTIGTCRGIVVRNENKCYGDPIGSEFYFDGKFYLVVDNNSIRNNLHRAETICTSYVYDMDNLFLDNTNFNQDISSWDVSNVVFMNGMFRGATSFNQNISSWKTTNLKMAINMFRGATSFNQNLTNWDVSGFELAIDYADFSLNSGLQSSNLPKFK